jgi:hypothetical protein
MNNKSTGTTTMRTAILAATTLSAAVMLHTAVADAAVRNFFSPKFEEARVAFCLQSNDQCGKPVADAWCQANGFDEAVLFQREEIPAEALATLYPDTGQRCDDETCVGFRQIKCRRDS